MLFQKLFAPASNRFTGCVNRLITEQTDFLTHVNRLTQHANRFTLQTF